MYSSQCTTGGKRNKKWKLLVSNLLHPLHCYKLYCNNVKHDTHTQWYNHMFHRYDIAYHKTRNFSSLFKVMFESKQLLIKMMFLNVNITVCRTVFSILQIRLKQKTITDSGSSLINPNPCKSKWALVQLVSMAYRKLKLCYARLNVINSPGEEGILNKCWLSSTLYFITVT